MNTPLPDKKERFKEYLLSKGFRVTTTSGILAYAERFEKWMQIENLQIRQVTYTDLLSFVKHCKEKGISRHTVNCHLKAVEHYYNCMIKSEELEYNPVLNLRMKGIVEQLPCDLLTAKQMELLIDTYPAETLKQRRNQLMIGLFVYQGLILEELQQLEPQDLDLNKGVIKIRKAVRLQTRVLKLKANQILPLDQYLKEIRPALQEQKKNPSDKLFFTIGSSDHLKEAVREIRGQLKNQHAFFKSFIQVRNSVISQWLKTHNIRQVQYMAGHNNIISTQRYVRANLDELKEQVSNYHPLA